MQEHRALLAGIIALGLTVVALFNEGEVAHNDGKGRSTISSNYNQLRHLTLADPMTIELRPQDQEQPVAGADTSTIVLLSCSDGFFDMWMNWLIFFEKLAIPNLPVYLFAEDEVTYDRCLEQVKEAAGANTNDSEYRADLTCLPWDYVFLQEAEKEIGAAGYRDQAYKKMMAHRPAIIERELESGRSVLFSDVDVIWKKNPLPYLRSQFHSETRGDVHILAQHDGKWLCPGFMMYRSFPETLAFVSLWRKSLEGRENQNQPAFNSLIKKAENHEIDINIVAEALPSELFPNGNDYFRTMTEEEREQVIAAHNNMVVGYAKKVRRFKSFGLWLVEEK